MRIAVFGAGGRTGRQVVTQALERGHEVTAFVRSPATFDAGVRVVEGDARSSEAVTSALTDQDAVVSVLALEAAEDEPQHSDATATIVDAMEASAVRRIVVTANLDVFGDDEVTGDYAAHAREHRRNRDRLKSSRLDWTIGAAGYVVDGTERAYVDEVGARPPARRITTAAFAAFTLDALERDEWLGRIVGVSAPG
jgi:putative NADH-flavin reductase